MATPLREALDERRVLLLPPTARDGRLTVALLAEAGVACELVPSLAALCDEIAVGCGAAVLPEEALRGDGVSLLNTVLERQPVWSDLPLVVLATAQQGGSTVSALRLRLGNCLLLERPVRVASLISAVQSALRTRTRQLQVRTLTEAGEITSTASALEPALERLAELLVPRVADACTVYILDDEQLRTAAQRFADPHHLELAQALQRRISAEQRSGPIWQAVESGQPELRETIAPELVASFVADEEQRRLIAAIAIRSHVILPLIVHGRPIGALALGMSGSQRAFDRSELPFLGELAARLAPALENLRLYAAEQRARAEAEQAVVARDELVALVTHDLRNPLTTLLAQAQLLQRRLARPDLDSARMVHSVAVMEEAARRMDAQIGALLDVARLRAGRPLQLDRAPVDLVALVREALQAYTHSERHELQLAIVVEPLVVVLDAARVGRVLDNLLSNAIKYSPDGGTIRLTVDCEQRPEGRFAVIAVADSGIGIPADEVAGIFSSFQRATNARDRIAGNGLGLSSVRQIVEAHGGWVTVESAVGAGSTFAVGFPLDEGAWRPE